MKRDDDVEVLSVEGREVRVTHPSKLYFSRQAQVSKLDLVRYYLAVAPGALAGIRDRPIVLKRFVARVRWRQQRERELLPTCFVHAVFTMPHELAPLALQNKRLIYGLLFRASAATLLEVARDPRHLGAQIGFFSVLHTWDQRLQHHPHVHCVLAAGGLAPDHASWISSRRTFFLPVKVLGRVFRGKFLAGLKAAFREGKLEFHGTSHRLPSHASSLPGSESCSVTIGSSTPSGPSADPNTRYATLALTLIASASRQQTGRLRGWPGQLPLARLRAQQPKARHERAGRRVPASLPAAPASTRLGSHPQLRLPRQPTASEAAATLLQPAWHLGQSDQN